MLERLEEIFKDLLLKWHCELIKFGGEGDHIHILFEAVPTIQLADLVKNLKSVSSRRMKNEYAEHLKQYYWKPYFWNRAYCIISVGGRANIQTLLKYIENQDEPARLRLPLTSSSPTVEE
jgi:putative transposase